MRSLTLLLALCVALAAGAAQARTWFILPDGSGDAPTIQAGIDSSGVGDTVMVGCGTYYEYGLYILDYKADLCLTSETGTPDCVTIDAGYQGNVITVESPDTTVSIVGLTFIHGYYEPPPHEGGYGGGMSCLGSNARITNCVFRSNMARDAGGGVFINICAPVFTDCIFSDNVAYGNCWTVPCDGNGGGVYCCWEASAVFIDCVFSGNRAWNGDGAGFACRFDCFPTLTGCLFEGNNALYGGGGVAVLERSSANLTNCTFSGNTSPNGPGGGVYCGGMSSASLDNCIVAFSWAGEALYWDGSGEEPVLGCSDLYANAGGDWVGAIADQYGVNGNICADPLFCDTTTGDFSLNSDSPCLDADSCGTIGAYGQGCGDASVSGGSAGEDPWLCVEAVTPCPFSASTRIDFSLSTPGRAKVTIFDVRGEAVATLLDSHLPAGGHAVTWDGFDSAGRSLPSGTYFARITAGDRSVVLKVVRIR